MLLSIDMWTIVSTWIVIVVLVVRSLFWTYHNLWSNTLVNFLACFLFPWLRGFYCSLQVLWSSGSWMRLLILVKALKKFLYLWLLILIIQVLLQILLQISTIRISSLFRSTCWCDCFLLVILLSLRYLKLCLSVK